MLQNSVETDIDTILATPLVDFNILWIAVSVKSYFRYLVLLKTLHTQCEPTFNSSDANIWPCISFSIDCLKYSN